ncbi:MAG: hypothetical protein HKN27_06995 [Silicimonas sp.]|nr:hypothetical protein [Silicimonas sp.]
MNFSQRLSCLEMIANKDIARPKVILIQTVRAGDDGKLVTADPGSGVIFGFPEIVLRQNHETVKAFNSRLESIVDDTCSKW